MEPIPFDPSSTVPLSLPSCPPTLRFITFDRLKNSLYEDHLVDWLRVFGDEKLPKDLAKLLPEEPRDNTNEVETERRTEQRTEQGTEQRTERRTEQRTEREEGQIIEAIEHIMLPENCTKITLNKVVIPIEEFRIEYSRHYLTTMAMEKCTDMIVNGALINNKDGLFAEYPLLVRSDMVNRIWPQIEYKDKELSAQSSSLWSGFVHFHYVVAMPVPDGLELKKDGALMANDRNILIMNKLAYSIIVLQHLQSIFPAISILYTPRGNTTVVTTNYLSKALANIEVSILWHKDFVIHGKYWRVLPEPSSRRLYPNMTSSINGRYQRIKSALAERLDEITLIWYCGISNRTRAINQGITKWSDKRCNADTLGCKGPIIRRIVDKMLRFNQGIDHPDRLVIPVCLTDESIKKLKKTSTEVYIRTITCCVDLQGDTSLIRKTNVTQILASYIEKGEWKHNMFNISNPTVTNVQRLVTAFREWLENHLMKFHSRTLYHLTPNHEIIKLTYRHDVVDLSNIIKGDEIMVKGIFSLSTRNIAKALTKHKLIDGTNLGPYIDPTDYEIDLMIKQSQERGDFDNKAVNEYIISSAVAMHRIVTYLRKNHTTPEASGTAGTAGDVGTSGDPEDGKKRALTDTTDDSTKKIKT